MAATNCPAAIFHIPRVFFSFYNANHVVDYYRSNVITAIKEIKMFSKHKVINLYQVLLDKFHMKFTATRKQSLTTNQNSVSKALVIVKHIDIAPEDTVWHRSKSPRFQQN
jgi:hypothetical protein